MVDCNCEKSKGHGGVITNAVEFSDEMGVELDGELLKNELEFGITTVCVRCHDEIDTEVLDGEYVEYPEEYEENESQGFLAKEQLHGME